MSKFIAIEGVIGVGKTTLTRLLKPYFDAEVLLEVFEENPFLADFYGDRERYAFQTQLFFLLSRYQQQKNAVPAALAKGNLLSDYTFAKDELFAWLNLKDDELAMYGRVHSALGEKIKTPDLLVYLHAEHDVVMQRIAMRDRPYERDMDPDYIRQLAAAYEAWLSNLSEVDVLRVDVSDRDVLSNKEDLQSVVAEIKQSLDQQGESEQTAEASEHLSRQVLEGSRTLENFQEFHRYLDRAKGFDPDLFINAVGLMEEVGELSKRFNKIWSTRSRLLEQGENTTQAHKQALHMYRADVGDELADVLAYILKLANYMQIDLEQAYVTKMRQNIDRNWHIT